MVDVRERLAAHLYPSALDLSPEGVVALRIGHASGLTWQIADEVLTVSVGGAPLPPFPLTGTISALATALAAAGVEIRYSDPDVLGRASSCLVSGSGDQNNDRLVAFQSNLWALLDAYGVEVRSAEANLAEALAQLQLQTADGEFLDFWGEFFAVPRLDGEGDSAYYARMVAEVLRPRSNAYAIQNAVYDLTGAIVTLREPWKEIFTLDFSALSDAHSIQDGRFFTWNVFQPIFHSGLTPAERQQVLDIIERNRPAGCLVVGATAAPPITYGNANLSPVGGISLTEVYNFGLTHYETSFISSSLSLSDGIEDIGSAFKWTLTGIVTIITEPDVPLDLFHSNVWDSRTWDVFPWNAPSVSTVVTQF